LLSPRRSGGQDVRPAPTAWGHRQAGVGKAPGVE
jgi:hypothetical protein